MAGRKSKSEPVAPGYERVPGPLRHYRNLATGEELSRRQYRQRVQGYTYESTPKGRARGRARRSYLGGWLDLLRTRIEGFGTKSKTAILRELRRLGLSPPHHGSKRRATRAEQVRQEAFMEFIGRTSTADRQVYPTLLGEGASTEP